MVGMVPNGGLTERRSRQPFLHIPVPWVFVLGYLAGAGLQVLLPVHLRSSPAWTAVEVAGGTAVLAGLALAGWGWLIFNRAGTSRVPGEKSHVLITSGPYRFTRNPMYVGLALAYVGEAGALLQAWPLLTLVAVLAYVTWWVVPIEEEGLEVFREYGDYCSRVRRWL